MLSQHKKSIFLTACLLSATVSYAGLIPPRLVKSVRVPHLRPQAFVAPVHHKVPARVLEASQVNQVAKTVESSALAIHTTYPVFNLPSLSHRADFEELQHMKTRFPHLRAMFTTPGGRLRAIAAMGAIESNERWIVYALLRKADLTLALRETLLAGNYDMAQTLMTKYHVNANATLNQEPLIIQVAELTPSVSDGMALLLKNGADPRAVRTSDKATLLHLIGERADFVKTLVTAGLDVNQRDAYGNTALHANVKNPQTIAALLAENADPTVTNNDGLTPLDQAHHLWQTETTEYTKNDLWQTIRLLEEAVIK